MKEHGIKQKHLKRWLYKYFLEVKWDMRKRELVDELGV